MGEPRDFPYERHVLVCVGPRCTERGGGEETRKDLKARNKEQGLKGRVRVCGVTCLDLCELGPNVVVWPSGETFHGVDGARAREIYDEAVAPLVPAPAGRPS